MKEVLILATDLLPGGAPQDLSQKRAEKVCDHCYLAGYGLSYNSRRFRLPEVKGEPTLWAVEKGEGQAITPVRACRCVSERYVDECFGKAVEAARVLHVYFDMYDMTLDEKTQERFVRQAWLHYVDGRFEQWMKWHLCCLFARGTEQPLPPGPEWANDEVPGTFLRGRGRQQLCRIVMSGKQGARCAARPSSILATLLELKRGFPPCHDWQVEVSMKDHSFAMARPPPGIDVSDLEQEVTRTCWEIAARVAADPVANVKLPSTRAHYEWGRAELGAMGHAEMIFEEKRVTETAVIDARPVGEFEGLSALFGLKPIVDPWEVYGKWGTIGTLYADSFLPHDRLSEFKCAAIGLVEPFKVRIITKGPTREYYMGAHVQSAVHSWLRRHPTFRLIGKTVSTCDVEWCAENGVGEIMVSGDYKAATDGLHRLLSEACVKALSEIFRFSPDVEEIFLRGLTGHVIEYSVSGGSLGVRSLQGKRVKWSVEQQNGQLMGSPMSFPVLCIVNAAVTRFSLEQSLGRSLTLIETAMLINGDDILFTVPDLDSFQLWCATTRRAGLVTSVGKTYVAEKWCVINSTIFTLTWRADWFGVLRCLASQVPVLNMGILMCRNVKSGKDMRDTAAAYGPGDLRGLFYELLSGWVGDDRRRILTYALKAWKPVLDEAKRMCPGQHWFIPRDLGGLGLPRSETWETLAPTVSRQQLKLAMFLDSWCNADMYCFRKAAGSAKRDGDFELWDRVLKEIRRSSEIRLRDARVGEIDPLDDVVSAELLTHLAAYGPGLAKGGAAGGQERMWRVFWRRGQAHGLVPDMAVLRYHVERNIVADLVVPPRPAPTVDLTSSIYNQERRALVRAGGLPTAEERRRVRDEAAGWYEEGPDTWRGSFDALSWPLGHEMSRAQFGVTQSPDECENSIWSHLAAADVCGQTMCMESSWNIGALSGGWEERFVFRLVPSTVWAPRHMAGVPECPKPDPGSLLQFSQ